MMRAATVAARLFCDGALARAPARGENSRLIRGLIVLAVVLQAKDLAQALIEYRRSKRRMKS